MTCIDLNPIMLWTCLVLVNSCVCGTFMYSTLVQLVIDVSPFLCVGRDG